MPNGRHTGESHETPCLVTLRPGYYGPPYRYRPELVPSDLDRIRSDLLA